MGKFETITARLPIRMRLALWYLASFFVVLALFGAGSFYAMRASIVDEFDRDLEIRIAGIKSFLDKQSTADPEKLRRELQEHGQLRLGGELLQISDDREDWVFRSNPCGISKSEGLRNRSQQSLDLRPCIRGEYPSGSQLHRMPPAAGISSFSLRSR